MESNLQELAIRDVAAQTGIAAATIRMWEQRYGFPRPARTTGGYRRYRPRDVEVLRRALAYRARGLSVGSALERARTEVAAVDRPTIFGTIADGGVPARPLRKRTLHALSRAIEDEAMTRAASPMVFGAFQREAYFKPVRHRYRRLARMADEVVVFADFARLRHEPGLPVEVPIDPGDALGNEWAVIVDAPGYAACLLAWEQQSGRRRGEAELDRRFEAFWTLDPEVVRRAGLVAARLAGRADAALGEELVARLEDRPLATEAPSPALTGLTNRMVAYLEAA
jgi:DICT domain-containing protein/predicted DNA-binding transcriptional regulator AlpA